jgi:hypothetical protein
MIDTWEEEEDQCLWVSQEFEEWRGLFKKEPKHGVSVS